MHYEVLVNGIVRSTRTYLDKAVADALSFLREYDRSEITIQRQGVMGQYSATPGKSFTDSVDWRRHAMIY